MSGAQNTIDPVLLAEFVDESLEMLSAVDGFFVELEASPTNLDLVQSIFRPVHSIKGNSALFGYNRAQKLAHELENILDQMRKGRMLVKREIISVLLEGVDELAEMLRRARAEEPEVIDEARYTALVEKAASACAAGPAASGGSGVSEKIPADLEDIYAECVAAEAPWRDRMSSIGAGRFRS